METSFFAVHMTIKAVIGIKQLLYNFPNVGTASSGDSTSNQHNPTTIAIL